MKTLLTLLLLCAPLAAAPPEPPKVPAKVVVPAGEPVVIVGETDCKVVEYHPLTPGLKVPSIVKALNIPIPPKNYVGEGQPGTYRLLAWTGNADGPSKAVEIEVVIGDGKKKEEKKVTPKPKPEPAPKPKPKPVPVVKDAKIQAVVVDETEAKAAFRAAFVGSADLAAHWKAKGHPAAIVVDQHVKDGATGQPPARLKPYLDRAKGKALPQLYLVNVATGDVLYEGNFPAAPADLIALLAKLGG